MFNRFGKKMKAAAVIFLIIGICASIAWGADLFSAGLEMDKGSRTNPGFTMEFLGIAVIPCFSFLSWLVSMFIYGFGQMVDNHAILANIAVKEDMEKHRGALNQKNDGKSDDVLHAEYPE